MRKLLLALLVIQTVSVAAQGLGQEWSQQLASESDDKVGAVATDAYGNTYVVGGFLGDSMNIGDRALYNVSKTGSWDAFIVKYDPAGKVVWAHSAGGESHDLADAICVDQTNGNVFVTGSFSDRADFGRYTLVARGVADVFIVRYDSSGVLQWATRAGGSESDIGQGIQVDGEGNVIVTGVYCSPFCVFDTDTLLNRMGWGCDMFLVKYDRIGNLLWTTSGGGFHEIKPSGVHVDRQGAIYVAGSHNGNDNVIGDPPVRLNGFDFSAANMFVAKFHSDGTLNWVISPESEDTDADTRFGAFDVDDEGNVLVAGRYYKKLSFGGLRLPDENASTPFTAFVDASGSVQWLRALKDVAWGSVSLSLEANGSFYIGGTFKVPTIRFGTTRLENAREGTEDVFFAKFDSHGNPVWAERAGGVKDDRLTCLLSNGDDIVLSGEFESPLFFIAGNPMLTIEYEADIFLVHESANRPTTMPPVTNIGEVRVLRDVTGRRLTIDTMMDVTQVQVVNMLGELCVSQQSSGIPADVDLSAHPIGMYGLKISTTNGLATMLILIP